MLDAVFVFVGLFPHGNNVRNSTDSRYSIFYLNQAGVKVFNAANKEIKNASISYNPIEIE